MQNTMDIPDINTLDMSDINTNPKDEWLNRGFCFLNRINTTILILIRQLKIKKSQKKTFINVKKGEFNLFDGFLFNGMVIGYLV